MFTLSCGIWLQQENGVTIEDNIKAIRSGCIRRGLGRLLHSSRLARLYAALEATKFTDRNRQLNGTKKITAL